MKLLHCLVLLCLVVFSIAAPSKLNRSDIGLPPGAYWESENVVVIPNEPLTAEEQAEQDRLDELADLKDSTTASYQADPADTSNYPNTTLSAREDDKSYAELWMSSERRNVGTLRGPRLYWKLFNCLQSLCKQTDTHWECNDKRYLNVCKIKNIVSTKHGEDWDATSTITVSYRLVQNNFGTNLEQPTYDMLAAMFSFMTEQDGNCRWVDFKWSRRTRICNIAHRALVAFPMKDDKSQPYTVFIATIETDAPRDGEFYCDGPLRKRVYDWFHSSAKEALMEASHVKGYVEAQVKFVSIRGGGEGGWVGWFGTCGSGRDGGMSRAVKEEREATTRF
ncbi:hypothetical protein DE146DRAFT_740668 [Phaeosphaeria sp. MPI-PUGE-AT-0046c]|nr:hypothetical protein DE146DRAFT_740668 [Phaeosphaeria sp. MPI-PUGE-AT-0046c]